MKQSNINSMSIGEVIRVLKRRRAVLDDTIRALSSISSDLSGVDLPALPAQALRVATTRRRERATPARKQRRRVLMECAVCKRKFRAKRKSGKYCSRSCSNKAYRERGAEKAKPAGTAGK